jgi:hypothetical protein
LITPGAILISAVVAIAVMVYNAKIARRRATVDLVMHMRQNQALIEARKTVLRLQEQNAQFAKWALLEHADSEESRHILEVLNTNEFVAVGIRERAFDEGTFKRLSRSRFIRDWDTLEIFVTEFRRSRKLDVLFTEMQWLANRWKQP